MSLQLPPPLAPWAPWLDLLPPDSALGLGPLLRRLDGLIGPLRVSPMAGSVEPDGFDGLARRGLPERLLLSEWLLADEAPLEFLRRLSQNESAFLQLARREPFAARSSVALLDVSPQILGGPRLVCLAALLVLARRAQTAGAGFRWGAWQMPGKWQGEVNRESLEWWLKLRGQGEASQEQRREWEEVWQSENADFARDELWLVGGTGLHLLAPLSTRFLEVRDELDPFAPDRATLARVDGRELRLVLPDETLGARLIRDPFAHAAPPVTGEKNTFQIGAPDSNFVWASSGFKGFLRAEGGALLVFSIPNSPSATVGPPKILRASNPDIVAVGRVGRATVAASLLRQPDGTVALFFEAWGRGSSDKVQGQFRCLYQTFDRNVYRISQAPLGSIMGLGRDGALAVLQGDGGFALALKGEAVLHDETSIARNAVWVDGVVTTLRCDEGRSSFMTASIAKTGAVVQWQEKPAVSSPLFKPPLCGWGGHPNTPLWALDVGNYTWKLHAGEAELEVRADANERRQVLGCIARADKDLGLLVTRDYREIWFRGRGEDALVCRFPSPIQHVAVCPFAPLMAVQGEGELGIYSLQHGAWLLKARWD